MTKMVKLFSLCIVLMFSPVSAEAETKEERDRLFIEQIYRLTVTKVDPVFHCFSLSNKLICNIPKKHWETDALPEVGDEIFLRPFPRIQGHRISHVETGELHIEIKDPQTKLFTKQPITVWISGESEYQLCYVRSKWKVTEPASGWLHPAVYTEFIRLSDGSSWARKLEKATVFEPGDRILVCKINEKEYLLIDLDVMSSMGTNVSQGKKLIQLGLEVVVPSYAVKATKE